MKIIEKKAKQACEILKELNIDSWLIFVRETPVISDPVMPMIIGQDVTWSSVFIYTSDNKRFALVGDLDADNFNRDDSYTKVITYTEGVKQDLLKLLNEINPKTIAINYSTDNVVADGLTHGMYLLLNKYLNKTVFSERLISAENLISKLRSRKLPEEIALIKDATQMASDVWDEISKRIVVGMSEIEVARIIDDNIKSKGGEPSFETIVNAGDKTSPGHGSPTNAKLAEGDLLHVDFGVKLKDYCSDIQRLLYFKRKNETIPPDVLLEAFEMVKSIITETGQACLPGTPGFEIDALARKMLTDNGYPEYQHALGHQLGRDVHDGGGIIGPKWERYGQTPMIPLELNTVTTLELEINLPGIGCVGFEEDVYVTENGAEYLCPRQMELLVK